MRYLLDTNIAIHARDGAAPVLDKIAQWPGQVAMSALSFAELRRGLHKRPDLAAIRLPRLMALRGVAPVLAFDAAAAEAYGGILAACGWAKGRDFDRMIGAHALSIGALLVTNNEADFRDIPGLGLENWM